MLMQSRVTDKVIDRGNTQTRISGFPVGIRGLPLRIHGWFAWLPVFALFLMVSGCAGRPLPSTPSGQPDSSRPLPSTPSGRAAPSVPSEPSRVFQPGQLPVIRIGLLVNRDSASLTGTGGFKVVDRSSGEVIGTSSSGQMWKMQAKGAWIDVSAPGGGAQGLYTGPIQVSPTAREGRIKVTDRTYRGSMEVVSNKNGKLTVVNILDLENYLRGVVPPEIGKLKESGIEALKAQAIAARTYTVSNLGRRKDLGFDLYGTVADQVYHGHAAEWSVADRAIAETRGMIATYGGKPIAGLYLARGMEKEYLGEHPGDEAARPGPSQDGRVFSSRHQHKTTIPERARSVARDQIESRHDDAARRQDTFRFAPACPGTAAATQHEVQPGVQAEHHRGGRRRIRPWHRNVPDGRHRHGRTRVQVRQDPEALLSRHRSETRVLIDLKRMY